MPYSMQCNLSLICHEMRVQCSLAKRYSHSHTHWFLQALQANKPQFRRRRPRHKSTPVDLARPHNRGALNRSKPTGLPRSTSKGKEMALAAGASTLRPAARVQPASSVGFGQQQRQQQLCSTVLAPHRVLRRPLLRVGRLQQQRQQQPGRQRTAALPPVTCIHADYAAKATDGAVLQRPLKVELMPGEIKDVFGFPRNLKDRYTLGGVLGAGSFGVVREATEKKSKRKYAVKTIPKSPKNAKSTPRYLLKLQTEVDAMGQIGASLDSVFLKDVFEDDLHIHLVMELCEGGSILDRLKEGEYSERQVADIMRSVLRFLAQCHTKGLIYRDVKPDNFMFLHQGPDSPVKATDFGLSIRHRPEDPPLKSRSGTPAYMAPEVIQQSYNEACDAWSAGIMMYQLLTGRFPFWDNVKDCTLQQVWKAILTDKVDFNAPELKQVSAPAKELLRGLLERDPRRRLKPSDALKHSWIQEPETASDLPLRSSVVQRLQRFATYGHLKQLVLRMIADEMGAVPTSQAEAQELMVALTGLFNELDVDQSGTVSVDELMEGLERLGYDITEAEMEQLMNRVDVNHDGSLELSEFVAGLVDWSQLQADKQWSYWVQLAFQKLDSNGDGFISLDEIILQLPVEGSTDSERLLEARRMLREADSNGDGRVSREEFAELLTGTSLPDTLNQYDPRLKHFAMDEDLASIDWTPATPQGKDVAAAAGPQSKL